MGGRWKDTMNAIAWWWGGSSCRPPFSCSKLLINFILPLVLLSGFLASLNSKTSNTIFTISPKGNNFWQFSPFNFFAHKAPSSSISTGKSQSNPDLDFQTSPSSNGYYASLNSSSLPPHAADQQQPVGKKEKRSNVTMVGNPKNETSPSHPTARLEKEYSNLERLEVGLARSRAAIKEATIGNKTQDPDYVPDGPMYWNANVFHRSYLEMEKQFKVYIYEEGDPPIFHNSPCSGVLGMEGIFINDMEISPFRTRDPEKAHVFFLPFSIVSIVNYVYIVDSHDWSAMKNTAVDYVQVISHKYPYWNRSLGADHFMLACHDWGPEISKAVPLLYNTSIRALCNANTSEDFHPSKDVSIPEINLPKGTMEGLLDGPSPSKRPILVFFSGGIHGYIRAVLLEHWENKDEDVQIQQYLPKGVSYYDKMRKSRYCICPSGYEVASPRMVEALYLGCVPVLIKDHYAAPFSDVLNWKTFSVEVSVKDIPNLKKILMGISQRQYIRMQRRGLQVRKHFEVNFPPKRYDVFHMILHSIWLRRLNVRIRDT